MDLDAVFFDFDGVICDSVNIKSQAFAEMYRQYGEEIEKKVVEYHLSNGGLSRYEKFRFWSKEFFNSDLSQNQLEELATTFSALVFQKIIESDYINGAIETLDFLKAKGVPAYIVTATPDNEIKKIIYMRNLCHFFAEVHGSPRTKEIIVEDIIAKKNYIPSRCLFVGDALSDLRAARFNKLNFLGITNHSSKVKFPTNTVVSNRVDISHFI